MPKDTNRKNNFNDWVEHLQEESWQLELLISGFAILALISLQPHLFDFIDGFDPHSMFQVPLGIILISIKVGWYIFIFNLILHLFVRGLWIGAIGLRYVSGDINYRSFKYNQKFIDFYRLTVGSYDNYIKSLEKISSILFSYTFLLFFIIFSFLISLVVFILWILLIVEAFNYFTPIDIQDNSSKQGIRLGFSGHSYHFTLVLSIFSFIYMLLGVMVIIDFLTFGVFKKVKNKRFSNFYFLVYRYFAYTSLSFLWRPMLLNFLDSKYTRKLLLLALPYIFIIAFFIPSIAIQDNVFYPDLLSKFPSVVLENSYAVRYYEDEIIKNKVKLPNEKLPLFIIPSIEIEGNYLKIFVRGFKSDRNIVYKDSTLNVLYTEGLFSKLFTDEKYISDDKSARNKAFEIELSAAKSVKRDSLRKAFEEKEELIYKENFLKIKKNLIDLITVEVDHKVISNDSIHFEFYYHPILSKKGLLGFIPIKETATGHHKITVQKQIIKKSSDESQIYDVGLIKGSIPFLLK